MAKTTETADAAALGRISEARERLRDAESRHLIAKENAKAAKASWEAAVEHLTTVIDSETRPMPLFDAAKAVDLPTVEVCGGTETHGIDPGTDCEIVEVKPGGLIVQCANGQTALADGEYQADEPTAAAIADARVVGLDGPDAWSEFWAGRCAAAAAEWRDLPIGDAGIAGKTADTLAGAGCETLGALVDRMSTGLGWNEGLKGIGEEKAAKIADQVAEFWRDHPEFIPA